MTIAAILRGDAPLLSAGTLGVTEVEHAIVQGVGPLLYRAMHDRGVWSDAVADVRDRLATVAREAVLIESLRGEHLARVVEALASEGVRPLLFKGAALAATHYPSPWLRARGDTDLLVHESEVERAGEALEELSFTRLPRPGGALVTRQSRYGGAAHGVPLAYDLHWRVADPHAFADALPYDDLARHAVADHPSGARRVSDVHALAVACVHRVAHHYDADHLLLLYDIHLIASAFGDAQWLDFVALGESRHLRTVFRRGLQLASEAFGLRVPTAVQPALMGGDDEPTSVFVGRRLRRIDILLSDLKALPTWRARAALMREHLLPERAYVLAGSPPALSAPRYVTRVVRGAAGWFRPL